jgi:hypothetical protein
MILLELNEVPWRVLDAYCVCQPGSALARVIDASVQLTTHAPDVGGLHPWSTWPTLHRGVSNASHGIDHFGQDTSDIDRTHPPIWDLLADAGIRSGVFGALHTYPLPKDFERYAFFVPDTFAAGSDCHPARLSVFQEFNLSMARASTRSVSASIDWGAAAAFLARAPMLGLKPHTALSLAGQLRDERRAPHLRARRRSYQSLLAFDLFEKLLRQKRPDFCNFFTNHVASSMHRYWAARFPEDFAVHGFEAAWLERFAGEIDFSMGLTNEFARRLLRFVLRNPEYLLVTASSMGQAAADAEPIRKQLYLRNVERFTAEAGLPRDAWSRPPAMDPDVALRLPADRVADFRAFLETIEIEGRALQFEERASGFFNLIFGQRNLDDEPDVRVAGNQRSPAELGLVNEAVDDEAASSGYHIPEGVLLVFDPLSAGAAGRLDSSRQTVSTLDVAPFVLETLGAPIPDYMRKPGAVSLG